VLLVDTYETARGVDHAVAVGHALKQRGKELLGIRLDSGDMNALARIARAKFDAAGLLNVKIYASNDLDEYAIEKLVEEGAPIDVFGVGTRLVTGGEQSALGGVYKLQAVEVNEAQRRGRKGIDSGALGRRTLRACEGLGGRALRRRRGCDWRR
jgi:nicotinate phosphoribosyltransferase